MKKTVLIFGISSFVGSNLAQILKDEYRVVGTYFETPVDIPGITCFPCDILKKDYVMNLTGIIRPDITIYAIGMSSLTECSLNSKKADALNSVGAVNACTASERVGSKFVFLSSCYVLGGEDVFYKEGDAPFPNNAYGSSLSATEFYVQRSCLNYLILRCSPLYGRSYNPRHPSWFEAIQANFAHNSPVLADDSVYTGFLDIYIVGRILKSVFKASVTNRLFHVSSRDTITRYDFAKKFCLIFKKDENLIQRTNIPFPIDQNNQKTKVSLNYYFRLDTFNIEDFLGTKMPTVEESLQLTLKRLSSPLT